MKGLLNLFSTEDGENISLLSTTWKARQGRVCGIFSFSSRSFMAESVYVKPARNEKNRACSIDWRSSTAFCRDKNSRHSGKKRKMWKEGENTSTLASKKQKKTKSEREHLPGL